ncbi:MAG: hypothetical protein KGL53_14365 [Elusimicrobia bacterium]|nr:hypothetical protein [Elusimicrobiota bacterium]
MRKKLFWAALAAVLALPVGVRAADSASSLSSLKTWFSHWKDALVRTAVEGRYRTLHSMTAVAAVRGERQDSADPQAPYWKGGWTEKRAAERKKERAELADAVQLILDGKTGEAQAAFDAFDKAHPKSSFKDDVAAGRAKLAELEKAQAPAAPAKPAQ